MLLTTVLLTASLTFSQDEVQTEDDRFVLPEMPNVDTASVEQIESYLGMLRALIGQIDDSDSFGAHWSRFITEASELTSHYRVRDPYLMTATITRIYDDTEEAMFEESGEHDWALGMDFDLSRSETSSEVDLSETPELAPLPQHFCSEGEHLVVTDENTPYNQRLDLCLTYGSEADDDQYFFADAHVVHRYAYAFPRRSGNGYFDIQAAASFTDETAMDFMRRTTRDLAQTIAEQIALQSDLIE